MPIREPFKRKSALGLRLYQKFFSFKKDEISSKRVLDVGSAKAQFQREAEKIGANVVSLDPSYKRVSGRTGLPDRRRKIGGVVNTLPFANNSFDVVFARRVIPDRVKGIERYKSITELLRVVRRDGWIAFGPFTQTRVAGLRTIRNFLSRTGFKFSQRNVSVINPTQNTHITQTYLKVWKTGDLKKLVNLIKLPENNPKK